MSKRQHSFLQSVDLMTLSIYLSLLGIGWLMVYTVGYNEELTLSETIFDLSTKVGKQTLWIGISLLALIMTISVEWTFWRTFAYPIYGIGLASLVGVLLFGITVKGANSWYSIGGFTLQPSEFVKFATCLAMAAFLSTYKTNLNKTSTVLISFGILAAPMALILLQPDAGSALVFLSFLILMFREGLSPSLIIFALATATLLVLGFIFPFYQMMVVFTLLILLVLFRSIIKDFKLLAIYLVIAAVSLFFTYKGFGVYVLLCIGLLLLLFSYLNWAQRKGTLVGQLSILLIMGTLVAGGANYTFNNIMRSHQQDRINVWLRPHLCDPQGSLYNLIQSKMAIGSGGFQGKGFLNGEITKGGYVPEQDTDFIFCTIAEEQGFIGSLGIIGLFTLLLMRILVIAERQNSDFSRQYAYCFAGVLFLHFFVNIGMTMGLVPVIGIPLPFISYGGSSVLAFTLMFGVLLKLDTKRYIG
ncbi:MAG: rod shape determining protein RodA [Polaribacter sp.]|jgi:rod shape determining protein RodA